MNNFTKTGHADFFDATGKLMLKIGLPITKNVNECLEIHDLYILQNHQDSTSSPMLSKGFPKDVYVKLADSLMSIYHDVSVIKPEQIEKTVVLVEMIFKEFQNHTIYLDLDAMRLDLERFKRHDYWTFTHVLNVALLSAMIGMRLGYADQVLKYLTLGALLHDLGKLIMPTEILNKPGSLTEEEYNIVKKHPLDGAEMLKDIRLSGNVMAVVKEHQERWNGKGYPSGMKGNAIHFNAQIVAIADTYEALTADRPYRSGIAPYHSLEMIYSESGQDFNPKVVRAFRDSLIIN